MRECSRDELTTTEERSYFVLIDEKEKGPYTMDDLRTLLKSGEVTEDSFYCKAGMEQWYRLRELMTAVRERRSGGQSTEQRTLLLIGTGLAVVGAAIVTIIIGEMGWFLVLLFAALIYFLPSRIAAKREHRNFEALFWLNALAGWTFFGWVAALVWALMVEKREVI